MTVWADRVKALGDPREGDFEEFAARALDLLNERLDESGLRTKVWGAMRYACANGHSIWVELEVGVEGPPDWRADGTYLACAFGGRRCETCGAETTHVDFAGDRHYDEPRAATEPWIFRVPREPVRYPTLGIYDDGRVIYDVSRAAFLFNDYRLVSPS